MTFQAGGNATAAALNAASGEALLGGINRTSQITGVSAETAWATTSSLALKAANTYRIYVEGQYSGSTANDQFAFRLRQTNISGTQLGNPVIGTPIATAGGGPYACDFTYMFTPPSDGNYVFCATVARLVGSGTCNLLAGSKLLVEQIGANTLVTNV